MCSATRKLSLFSIEDVKMFPFDTFPTFSIQFHCPWIKEFDEISWWVYWSAFPDVSTGKNTRFCACFQTYRFECLNCHCRTFLCEYCGPNAGNWLKLYGTKYFCSQTYLPVLCSIYVWQLLKNADFMTVQRSIEMCNSREALDRFAKCIVEAIEQNS